MKKITVFTSTRAEYGLMKTLIQKLQKETFIELNLIVTSAHLDPKFGNTINEIKNDGIDPKYVMPISIATTTKRDMCLQASEVIKLVSSALEDSNSDYLMVLGDRFETLGAVFAAHLLGIEVIHLHGGESSFGAVDDKLRHAISQLSKFHFTSSDLHKKKVESIVGSSLNVFNVGPLVIDGLINLKNLSRKQFENLTGFEFSKTNLLITFHSETLSPDLGLELFSNLLKVLSNIDCNVLFTAPNADTGSEMIIEKIQNFISQRKNNFFYIPSLGQELYLNAIILFDCVMGNSSSGIIEAPLVKTKVLNIGNRQKGRYKFGSVLDVMNNDFKDISNAVKCILEKNVSEEYHHKRIKDIYADRSPSKQIINILKNSFN